MRKPFVLVAAAVTAVAAAGLLLLNGAERRTAPPAAHAQPALGKADPSSTAAKALARPLDRFGLGLLQRQARLSPEGNVIVSPVSLHAVLSMVLNGAAGETMEEMRRALGVESLTPEETNRGWADLIWLAQSGETREIQIADSLWMKAGFPFRQAFLDLNRDHFAAETRDLPADPVQAADEINGWVKDRTGGHIKNIVNPDLFDAQTILALFNTVHLDVRWTHFDETATAPGTFTLSEGEPVQVPMMQAADLEARVTQSERYDAVALETEGPVTAWIIVPKGKTSAEALLEDLSAEGLEAMYDDAAAGTGSLALPRFTSDYEVRQLKESLSAMGMPLAFSADGAEFPGIADVGSERIYISEVVQKTYVDMNEQGVEAAAASGAIMRVTSMPADYFDIRADRPFLFVLAEEATEAPLFMGLVRDPR